MTLVEHMPAEAGLDHTYEQPLLTRSEIVAAMQAAVPAGRETLSAGERVQLQYLTDRLLEVEGDDAADEYDRYVATADRELELPRQRLAEQLGGKTVLITGGTGLIGSELASQLGQYGPTRIVSVSRGVTPTKQVVPGVEYRHADVRDRTALHGIFADVQPDIIYHVAADKYNHEAETRQRHTLTTNVLGTMNVIEGAQGLETRPQLVYASTGKATRPFSPDTYASSKKTGESLMAQAAEAGLRCSGVRFTHVVDDSNIRRKIHEAIDNGDEIRLHDPEIWMYTQSAKESAQMLLLAGLDQEPGVMKMQAINNLGLPLNLADLGLGALARRGVHTSPIYFSGRTAGYEEKAWPGLYDPKYAGDVTAMINAIEAPTAEPSPLCYGVDTFRVTFDTSVLAEGIAPYRQALESGFAGADAASIRTANQQFSWKLLDATIAALPDETLSRTAQLIGKRMRLPADPTAPVYADHVQTDAAFLQAYAKRIDADPEALWGAGVQVFKHLGALGLQNQA